MKKLIAIFMALMMVLTVLVSCGKEEEPKDKNESKAPAVSTETSDSGEEESESPVSSIEEVSPVESSEVSVENEYDDVLIGAWTANQDGETIVFKYEAEGKGSLNMDGISVDMTWNTNGGKLTMDMSFYGMEENIVSGADYVVEGTSLTITYEEEPLVLTATDGEDIDSDASSEASDITVVPGEKEYDTVLLGTWEVIEDGIAVTFTFKEGGKGKMSTMGLSADLAWYVVDGKLNVSMSFMGESEEVFENAEYTVDVNKLVVTVDGETIMFVKEGADADTETSATVNPVREHDSAVLGTWTATNEGTTFTFTFEEEGEGSAIYVQDGEETSFYIDWYTNGGILEITATEVDGVEINEPLASLEYEATAEGLALTEEGKTLVFVAA